MYKLAQWDRNSTLTIHIIYNFTVFSEHVTSSEQLPVQRFPLFVHFHGIAHGAEPAEDH